MEKAQSVPILSAKSTRDRVRAGDTTLLIWISKLSNLLVAAALIWFGTQVIAAKDKNTQQDEKLDVVKEWSKDIQANQAALNRQVMDIATEIAVLKATRKQ